MEKGLHLQNSARRAIPECRKQQKLLEGRRLERLPGCGVLPPAPCHTPAWEIQTLCCFMPEITVTSAPVSFLPLYFLFHSFSLFLSCPSFAFPPCPSLLSLSSLRSSCIYLQRIVFLFPFLVGFLTGVCIGEGGGYAKRDSQVAWTGRRSALASARPFLLFPQRVRSRLLRHPMKTTQYAFGGYDEGTDPQ